jgi:excisionase family DNA binding protein
MPPICSLCACLPYGSFPYKYSKLISYERFTVDERIYVSPAQAAERVGVTKETIRSYIAKGKLPAKRLPGGYYRICVTDLEEMLGGVSPHDRKVADTASG